MIHLTAPESFQIQKLVTGEHGNQHSSGFQCRLTIPCEKGKRSISVIRLGCPETLELLAPNFVFPSKLAEQYRMTYCNTFVWSGLLFRLGCTVFYGTNILTSQEQTEKQEDVKH